MERILEFPIRKVVVQSEHSLFVNSDYHGIRMDVYADDEAGTVFDVEMQTRQDVADELPKRSRYYQSQMDLGLLKPGEHYRNLPNSYVIFICTFDPFGEAYYRYTFQEQCQESGRLLEDGSYKIFLSTEGRNDSQVPEELIAFMRYVKLPPELWKSAGYNGEEDELLQELEARKREVKKNRKWEEKYVLFEEMLAVERREGYEEGREEGREEGVREMSLNMLRKGVSCEDVAECAGVSIETVETWKAEL